MNKLDAIFPLIEQHRQSIQRYQMILTPSLNNLLLLAVSQTDNKTLFFVSHLLDKHLSEKTMGLKIKNTMLK